jgi:phage-related protein
MREVYFFKEYFKQFYSVQSKEIQKKIDWVIGILQSLPIISEQYLKHVRGEVYEMRVGISGRIFRVFCCFDEGKVIVLFNGFEKKTQKTPERELDKALRILGEYKEAKARGEITHLVHRAS